METRCVLARENRGSFLAVYVARVRITVQADGGNHHSRGPRHRRGPRHITGRGPRYRPQGAETDATKRALATFGKPFGLELYRGGKPSPSKTVLASHPSRHPTAASVPPG